MTEQERDTSTATDLAGFDSKKKANDGIAMNLFHPVTKVFTNIFFVVHGEDSDVAQDVLRKQQKRKTDRLGRGGFRSIKNAITPEELEADKIEVLAACTSGWYEKINDEEFPEVTFFGKSHKFSEEMAKRIYREIPAIREQVDEAWGDRANFI